MTRPARRSVEDRPTRAETDDRRVRPDRPARPDRPDRPSDRTGTARSGTALRDRPSRPAGAKPSTTVSPLRSWRVWAVPVLVVLTVLAVLQAVSPGEGEGSRAALLPAGSGDGPVVSEAPSGAGTDLNIPTAELPPGGAFPVTGAGTWHVLPGTTPQVGTGRVYTYTVEVEDGTSVAEGDDAFASAVTATLDDPRSWIGSGQIALRRIDTGAPDFRVSLTSQMTARAQCGYDIRYEASCWKPDIGRVLINSARWVRGAGAFDGQLGLYRQYAINHEVGHVFRNNHVPCQTNGALAPVMMQQSFGTSNDYLAQLTEENPQGTQIPRDGKTCQPNAWPFPQGGAPAAG